MSGGTGVKQRIDDFVLGNMSPEERAAIEAARRHDPELDRAIEDAEDRLAPLSLAAGDAPLPSGLWDRIEAALDVETGEFHSRRVELLGEGGWHDFLPGIKRKTLWSEQSWLLRCAPGAEIPSHPHLADEHLLVISGDVLIGSRIFGPGDFIASPAGSMHAAATTRAGCLIMVHYAS